MEQPKPQLLNRDGRPVRVQKIPMSTGKSKFKSGKKYDPRISVFEQFASSNSTKGGCKSF
jgi:hypothetical protein